MNNCTKIKLTYIRDMLFQMHLELQMLPAPDEMDDVTKLCISGAYDAVGGALHSASEELRREQKKQEEWKR